MAVEKMKIVSMIGKYEMLSSVIDAYLDSGCYQPEHTSSLIENVEGFTHINEENPFSEKLQKISEILTGSGVNLEQIKTDHLLTAEEIEESISSLEINLGNLQQQKNALEVDIARILESIAQLKHFHTLNLNLQEVFDSKFIMFRFGRLPAESYEKLKIYDENPHVLFFPSTSDKTNVWGMYITTESFAQEVDDIFATLYFERLQITDVAGTPGEVSKALQIQINTFSVQLKVVERIIEEFLLQHTKEYLGVYTQLKHSFDAFEIRRFGSRYGDTFMLLGWIPERQIKHFTSFIDKIDAIECKINDVSDTKFTPPIRLHNKRLFKSFEFYVNMYGTPAYNEIDPTSIVAVAYTIFYGIMFADLGQGILLSIVGYLMYKLKGMEVGRILIPCGISGAFFGTVAGSVFGFEHALDPMFKAMGFASKPIIVMDEPLPILAFSIALGVILMIISLFLGIYSRFKKHEYEGAIYGENGICGMIIYLSILIIASSLFVPAMKAVTTPVLIIGIAIPSILIFFKEPLGKLLEGEKGWRPESWGEYCALSFFEVFEAILNYVTNTVSYLRIGAFVLVHAGLMSVFFIFADMLKGGVGSIILIIVGNIFVLVLEGLLVSIQALRLMFYELFSRFYFGEGRPFEPISVTGNINKLK